MKKMFVFASAVLLSVATIAGDGKTYSVDAEKSVINWVGEKVTGKHNGTLLLKEGSVEFKDGKPVAATIKVDMNAITCSDLDEEYGAKLIGHLKSDDFFSVEKYPIVEFKATKFEEIKEGKANYKVTGNLTIKGITNEISFNATINEKSGTLLSNANVVFDRTKWDIKYGSGSFFDDLGDKAIYDEIKMDFTLSAK